MANKVYPKYRTALMAASANVSLTVDDTTDGPFVALIDTGAVAYNAAHEFYSDISAGVIGTPVRIDNPTVGSVSDATFDGENITFSAVSGNSVEAIVIYRKNSGANTTWRLVAFLDTGITGIPFTPNGTDATLTFNAAGIFTL
jgi:activator of HSP90 ATPase